MKSSASIALAMAASMSGLGAALRFSTINHRPLSQSPPYNQRKARHARRQRHAAGDRHAFR